MAKKKGSAMEALKNADKKHNINTEKYVKVVDGLYGKAIDDLAELAVKLGIPTDGTDFSFSKHSGASDEVRKVLEKLTARITSVVESGNRAEWIAACAKSNQFIESILNTTKLTKTTLRTYQDRNLEALAQFQTRKVNGLGLSDRVWKYVAPLETEVEMVASTKYYKHGINSGKTMTKFDRAIGEGTSAAEFSREIRSCLKEPNKLFRRVRDKNGNLTLSKAAKLYHPGQGVYRSSYKNAMRMTRSEINLAYRQSDSMRWQQLDFVVGMEVQLSNNHTTLNPKGKGTIPLTDMCDELAGKYPKDFKFVGWHPQCRCFATPILKSLKEVKESYDENGAYKEFPSANAVKDLPQGFQNYIQANYDRVFGQNGFAGWRSIPYYMKDNPQFVDMAMHPEKYIKALSLSLDIEKLLSDFRMYGFNHQGSKKFNDALDRALKAKESGDQAAFDKAMEEMAAIQKKNEGSTASKAAKKQLKKEVVIDERQKLIDEDLATFTDAQLANIKELENALKQKKGLRMTYEEANTGKENPMYAVYKKTPKYLKDENGHFIIEKGKIKTNPEYAKMKGYAVNCQTCTVIHELRMRGFNVEAISNYRGKVWSVYKKEGVGSAHEGYRIGKWLDQDGKPVGPTYAHQWAAKKGVYIKDKGQVEQFFEEYSGGKDGRFEICVDWKGGSAHVFCADRKNGKWFFFDPQSGRENIFGEYAASAKLHTFGIIRTDDKLINPKLFSTFIPKGEIPIVVPGTKEAVLTREQKIEEARRKRHANRTKEKEESIRKYWEEHKKKTAEEIDALKKIIESADGIEGVDVKTALDSINGVPSTTKTKNGEFTAPDSIEQMKKKVEALKPFIKQYSDAVSSAGDIMSDLDGISDISFDSLKDAIKSKKTSLIKAETDKLKDIKKSLEELTYIDNPIEVAKKFSMQDAIVTNEKVAAKIAEIENIVPPYSWSGTQLEYQAKKLKFEAEEYLGTNKYGAQDKYKTWQVSQAAYFKQLEVVNKKIEAEAIKKSIAEYDTYLSAKKASKKPGKIETAVESAKAFLASGDYASAKAQLLIADQIKAKNEASAASKAKQNAAKKAEKQYWKDAEKKIKELKKKIDPSSKDYGVIPMIEEEFKNKNKQMFEDLVALIDDTPIGASFDSSCYTQDRKNKAIWCKSAAESHKHWDAECEEVWNAASAGEQEAWYAYTCGSGHMNRPMRGYDHSWSNYVGVGKVDLNNEGGEQHIRDMYNLLERAKFKSDRWLQRGVETFSGVKNFLGISSQSEITQALVGKEITDMSFISCGSAKGTGFSGYIFNIYCPKGTKGFYARPHSAFGDGENESILQAGTKFVIRKVEIARGNVYIDIDVIGYEEHPQLKK